MLADESASEPDIPIVNHCGSHVTDRMRSVCAARPEVCNRVIDIHRDSRRKLRLKVPTEHIHESARHSDAALESREWGVCARIDL